VRRRTLKLLPGLKWSGKMHVTGKVDGGYLVEFDAEGRANSRERYIYDRAVLTAQQIEEWTGINLDKETGDGSQDEH
jgi:hypothetical protein